MNHGPANRLGRRDGADTASASLRVSDVGGVPPLREHERRSGRPHPGWTGASRNALDLGRHGTRRPTSLPQVFCAVSAFLRPSVRLAASLSLFGFGAAGLAETPPADSAPAPYLQLRATTLNYNGPTEDIPNLTEYRIGWFGPSDPKDPVTGDLWWAANAAVQEANEEAPAAPPCPPFRLVPRWSVDPWGTGVSQLARMVYDEKPLALLGSIDSAATHLAEQVVAKAQLALVSPVSTDASMTLAGVSWMFSCAPRDAAIAESLTQAVLASLPVPRCESEDPTSNVTNSSFVLLACTDHESRMTAREVARAFGRAGRAPAARHDLAPGATVSPQLLAALTRAAPSAVVIVAGADDAARLTHVVRQALPEAAVFGSQTMGRQRFLELAGPDAEGVRFPLVSAPSDLPPEARRFCDRFAAARGHAPDYATLLTYDATRLLIAAIRRAGPNRGRVRDALAALSPWPGYAGTIRFDGTGQNTRATIGMGTIRAGGFVPLPAVSGPLSSSTPSTP